MKYLEIELNGYKHFMLNGISFFKMKITSNLQLIIGTNGSGKSSLMRELSPLPAQHTDFTKEGSKLFLLEHNHRNYRLASRFSHKQTHSFELEGEELNPGGTITIQRELVKEHFGYTQDIHELLTEREKFDAMSFSRRKEWFMRLCDTNYDYAISVYNKLKEQHRDINGAIRLAKKTLVQESEKLLRDDEVVCLQRQAHGMHECLNVLLEYRKPVEADLVVLGIKQDQLSVSLRTTSAAFQAAYINHQTSNLSAGDYASEIQTAEAKALAAQSLIEKFSQQHTANSQKIRVLEKAESNTIEKLETEISRLCSDISMRIQRSLIGKPVANAAHALTAFQAAQCSLLEIFSTIPANLNKKYSQHALSSASEKLAKFILQKDNLVTKLTKNRISLAHMQQHRDTPDLSCPACHHKFSLNYNEDRFLLLTRKTVESEDELATIVYPAISEQEQYVQDCKTYGQMYRQYVQITNSMPALAGYWEYLNNKQIITAYPETGLVECGKIEADLQRQVEICGLITEVKNKEELLASLLQVGTSDLSALVQANLAIDAEINEHTEALQAAVFNKKHSTEMLKQHTEYVRLRAMVTAIIQSKRKVNKEEIETHRRLVLNQLIRDMQSALASVEQLLGSAGAQKGIVDNLTNRINEYTIQEQALALLVKQLSPTEGLIAEGLLGFIKNYVDQMNALISKVWSYPLAIVSCDVVIGDSVDLDYKFPLTINEDSNIVSDVNKGSTGMKEIINLAFRLTAMQYLGLQNNALCMDEFANSFDKDHRLAASIMIKQLLEQRTFSQIFIVSHYLEMYGGLSSAEVCVLNPTNILVPEKYNEHVTMW